MKKSYLLIVISLMTGLIMLMGGCEYKGPTAMYYQSYEQTLSPTINQMDPVEAVAGVNNITIIGENFSESAEKNQIYFDGDLAEIINNSSTSITVLRPNITGDSVIVKVVNRNAHAIAQYTPYKITAVYEKSGQFIAGEKLTAIEVDDSENVYVAQTQPNVVYKITPEGEKIEMGQSQRPIIDVKIGPDGKLILFRNTREIIKMDVETGEQTEWISISERTSYGDFDTNSNLYAGGSKTDLLVIKPDGSVENIGVYEDDKILGVCVFNNTVYLLVELDDPDAQNPELAIWKHQILDGNGSLGDRELVLDWAATGEFVEPEAESEPNTFVFGEDGTMYVGTDHTYPILMVNPDGSQDILYKKILPSTAVKLSRGSGNRLYMIQGGESFEMIRIEL